MNQGSLEEAHLETGYHENCHYPLARGCLRIKVGKEVVGIFSREIRSGVQSCRKISGNELLKKNVLKIAFNFCLQVAQSPLGGKSLHFHAAVQNGLAKFQTLGLAVKLVGDIIDNTHGC